MVSERDIFLLKTILKFRLAGIAMQVYNDVTSQYLTSPSLVTLKIISFLSYLNVYLACITVGLFGPQGRFIKC